MDGPRIAEPKLHVDMDAFFVEVERLDDPSLRGLPVAVGGDGPRGVVASASYEARACGVRSALPMSRAKRMCPDLVVVPGRHRRYAEESERVFAVFRDFTPLVQGLSLDEAFLDVGGLRYHYRDARRVADAIRARILDETGLPASVGAATVLFLAKMASGMAKPDGVYVVAAGTEAEFLRDLPVRKLWGVGKATGAELDKMGIATVGDLARTPLPVLRGRLGEAAGVRLHELAHGVDPREVEVSSAAKSVSAEQTYPADISDRPALETELLRLADRVSHRLRASGLSGRTVSVKVRFSDFSTVTRSETLDAPVDLTRVIFRSARRLLDRARPGDRPVRLLGVGVSGLTGEGHPREAAQPTLEEAGGRTRRWDDLAEAVDGARRRFGPGVVRPARLGSADPPGGAHKKTNRI